MYSFIIDLFLVLFLYEIFDLLFNYFIWLLSVPGILTVFINQVEVGIISVSDFAKIEKSVFLDSTTCLLQLLTLPKAIFRILNSAIPVFTTSFVLIILLGITFAPSEFLSGVHALLKMTPDQLQVFAYMVWWLFITIFIMAYLLDLFHKSKNDLLFG